MKLHAAPYGGPIAITKNPKQIPKSGIVKPVISIFTSSGVLISTINVSYSTTRMKKHYLNHVLILVELWTITNNGLD